MAGLGPDPAPLPHPEASLAVGGSAACSSSHTDHSRPHSPSSSPENMSTAGTVSAFGISATVKMEEEDPLTADNRALAGENSRLRGQLSQLQREVVVLNTRQTQDFTQVFNVVIFVLWTIYLSQVSTDMIARVTKTLKDHLDHFHEGLGGKITSEVHKEMSHLQGKLRASYQFKYCFVISGRLDLKFTDLQNQITSWCDELNRNLQSVQSSLMV